MRISGGQARGIRLKVPPGARPAAERTRQAVFGSLGERVEGARVLDLYAGSGAYGLEALSRGAAEAVLVDNDGRALAAAKANAQAAGFADRTATVRRDVGVYVRSSPARRQRFDLVFCDPPYVDAGVVGWLLPLLRGVLAPGAVVVIEGRKHPDASPVPTGYILEADRRYGDTRVLIYSQQREGGEG